MKYILFLILPLFTGCICLNPDHKKSGPPIANTGEVIASLEKTKTELDEAGESNTVVGERVDKALTLAERLEKLLEQIEDQSNSKLVKEPIK
jgi:hypothetical protein